LRIFIETLINEVERMRGDQIFTLLALEEFPVGADQVVPRKMIAKLAAHL
jgi:hypothetical protein